MKDGGLEGRGDREFHRQPLIQRPAQLSPSFTGIIRTKSEIYRWS